jgi:hypothetical protein
MNISYPKQLSEALKEWAVAVRALEAGKTIMLLRKGGIRETNSNFEVTQPRIWLYPTYEHQKPDLLKPEYQDRVTPVESGWHPETVTISSYADITDVLLLKDAETVAALHPYHIWNEAMISDRLKWKRDRLLTVLLLRVYRLTVPQILPFDRAYAGCKSWLTFDRPLSIDNSTPVLDDFTYQQQLRDIKLITVQTTRRVVSSDY